VAQYKCEVVPGGRVHVTVALVTIALGRHRSSSRAANGRKLRSSKSIRILSVRARLPVLGPPARSRAAMRRQNGNVAGAVGPVFGRPCRCEYALCRHAGRRTLEDDKRWHNLDPTHRQASVALDRESLPRSHRPYPQNFDRGDGPHRQWDGLFDWGVLLYRFRRPAERNSCTRKMVVNTWGFVGRIDTRKSERGRGWRFAAM